jgi:hypothetical protein
MAKKLHFDLTVNSNALLCANPEEFYSTAYIRETDPDNFRLVPNVKNTTKLANMTLGQVLQAENCAFSDTNDTLDSIDVDVCGLSIMKELCQFDIESSFLATQLAAGSNGSFEIASFMNYYYGEIAGAAGEDVESIRWQGDTTLTDATLSLCDGYEKLLGADTSVIDVAVVTGGVTTANVLAEMQSVYEAATTAVLSQGNDLRFYVSRNVATAYQYAAAIGNTMAYITEALPLTYLGIPVVVCDGMSDDKMVFTSKWNLIYAFDAMGDKDEVRAINMKETTGDATIRLRADLKIGFQIANGGEIVYYS